MRRPIIVAAVFVALAGTVGPVSVAHAARCYPPPVDTPVTRAFQAPACEWCPGHRGLDFATRPGQVVLAVAPGVASFVGVVARVRYVVVAQDDGLRATYGQLAASTVRHGARITAGAAVGTASDLLFFGLRDGERYLDPAPLLGVWQRRARLVPTDGSAPRPGPPARLVCRKSGQVR